MERGVPPRSPVLKVALNIIVEWSGWWMSPIKCRRYLAMNAR